MNKKFLFTLPALVFLVLVGFSSCSNNDDIYSCVIGFDNKITHGNIEKEYEIRFENQIDVQCEKLESHAELWGSFYTDENSNYIFVTNGDFSIHLELVQEGDEFLGFTLSRIYRSVIETTVHGAPVMNDPVHAVLSGGNVNVRGTIRFETYPLNTGFSNIMIFSAYKPYFKLLPVVVGDMTSGDVSFIIENMYEVLESLDLETKINYYDTIIVENISVVITDITLIGRRRDDVLHRANIIIAHD